MTKIASATALAATMLICSTSLALAHASLTPREAANGASVKVAIAIPHGCDGAPTDTVIIKLPEGFVSVKPQVKAGWTIEITKADYAKSYELHGKKMTSGPVEIKWTGGSVPDDQFDEFVVRGTVQGFDAGAALPFATTQLCGVASVAWDQVPAEGRDAHSLEHPAPVLTVTPTAVDAPDHKHGAVAHKHGAAAQDHGGMSMDAPAAITLGDLEISGAFTRATLPSAKVGGGFLTIVNKGGEADRLIGAASPVAEKVQLHQMKMEGDVMKMAELEHGIEIPAGETVVLAPGGLHIMFMGLKQAFEEGSAIPVTLTFEKAGTVEVQLQVGAVGADAATGTHAPMHHDHGATPVDQAGPGDVDAITTLLKSIFETPASPLLIAPVVVSGEYAIAGWSQDGSGGRALLRKAASGWAVHLCSGDGLKDAGNLVRIGVPDADAQQLAADLAKAESTLDPALLAQFSAFDGTVMVDDDLI
ncbi:MAG: copper uptake system-associated protein [Devosia sp.]|nr:copper uptake system-associated protein [Devosia sp.]